MEWMRVREDAIRRADGTEGIYGVIEKPNFALIVPFDGEGFWLVEQFRYPVGRCYWEFPQGSWETRSNVDPEGLARGELKEETGLSAGEMRHLGFLHQPYGACERLASIATIGDEWSSPARSATRARLAAYALFEFSGE